MWLNLAGRWWRQPSCDVVHVGLDVFETTRVAFNLIPWWFHEKGRAPQACVPVVVDEMMKTRFGHPAPQGVAPIILLPLEGDGNVEGATCGLAHAGRNDARMFFTGGDSDRAFVRMGREEFDAARTGGGIAHERVRRLGWCDSLVVSVTTGMIVRPRDGFRILIVARAPGFVRVRVPGMEEMGRADAPNRAEG